MTNDYLLESAQRHPLRLAAFVNAPLPWGEAALYELERGIIAGAKGIGEVMPDGQGFSLDDESLLAPLVDLALERKVSILIHASEPVGHHYAGKGRATPEAIYRLVQRFPQAPLIVAHWGGGLPFYELMPEVKEQLTRVYYDTAASPYLYQDDIFPLLVPLIGHKLLFGTDYPLVEQAEFLERFRRLELPEEQQAAILGGNAQRLFGLPQER
jgi:predicted TIM-barrel fold metal-dependent hydrolase